MRRRDLEDLLKACGGDGRFIGLALAELGVEYVEDYPDAEFLIARVTALREEEILYNWEHDDDDPQTRNPQPE